MKVIAISMRNNLFAGGTEIALKRSGNFRPIQVSPTPSTNLFLECIAVKPDIIFIEVRQGIENEWEETLEIIEKLKKELPQIKVAIICDEKAYPKLAGNVKRARQQRKIDAFYFTSITIDYLVEALDAI
ncbi:MAG: hypothetical protein Q4A29_10695 [Eubacteriales bacterium]|nr:hypothetical protein [Eubacteriales bacterium]